MEKGDAVMVTLAKVKKKNIEFHLGGGGANDSGAPYISTYVPKSNREKRLEDAYTRTDPARKKRLKEDLDDKRAPIEKGGNSPCCGRGTFLLLQEVRSLPELT